MSCTNGWKSKFILCVFYHNKKYRFLSHIPRVSDSLGLGWSQRIYISDNPRGCSCCSGLEITHEENSPLKTSYSHPTRKGIQKKIFKKRCQIVGQLWLKVVDAWNSVLRSVLELCPSSVVEGPVQSSNVQDTIGVGRATTAQMQPLYHPEGWQVLILFLWYLFYTLQFNSSHKIMYHWCKAMEKLSQCGPARMLDLMFHWGWDREMEEEMRGLE